MKTDFGHTKRELLPKAWSRIWGQVETNEIWDSAGSYLWNQVTYQVEDIVKDQLDEGKQ